MDSVRFGRALGSGARSAAKALAVAVDAASAPNPTKPAATEPRTTAAPRTAAPPTSPPSRTDPPRPPESRQAFSANQPMARTAARASNQVRQTRKGLAEGRKRFGEAVWGPFAKLSRVLWLEITGSFFGIFALFAGHAVWANRADFAAALRPTSANHDARMHLLVFLAMSLGFGYFCISSFVRAYRR